MATNKELAHSIINLLKLGTLSDYFAFKFMVDDLEKNNNLYNKGLNTALYEELNKYEKDIISAINLRTKKHIGTE